MSFTATRILSVSRCQYNFVSGDLRHDFYHLLYVTDGCGTISFDGVDVSAEKHHLYVIAPGVWHDFRIEPGGLFRTLEVRAHVDDHVLFAFLARLPRKMQVPYEDVEAMLELMLEEALRKQPHYKETLVAQFIEMIMKLLRYAQYIDPNQELRTADVSQISASMAEVARVGLAVSESARAMADRIRQFIHDHYDQKLSLQAISKRFAINRTHLCKIFRERFQVSPMQYLKLWRIERAKDLLRGSELPVTDIAVKSGFHSIHHFSRTFALTEQMSPTFYRQQAQHSMFIDVESEGEHDEDGGVLNHCTLPDGAGRWSVMGDRPVQLVFYSTCGFTQEAFDARFGTLIQDRFPQYVIRYIDRNTVPNYSAWMSGSHPLDIVFESIVAFRYEAMRFDLLQRLDVLLQRHRVDVSHLEPSIVNAVRSMSDGHFVALPVLTNTLALYYNMDLFDRFSVPYPQDHMTWDEVLELNRRQTVRDGSKQYVGLGISLDHYFRMNPMSFARSPLSVEESAAHQKWKVVYEVLARALEAPGFRNKIQELRCWPGLDSFALHQDAAMFIGPANIHSSSDLSRVNWDVVAFPIYKEAPGVNPQSYPTLFGIAKTSRYKEEAMEVIKYMVSDDFQLAASKRGFMPVVRSMGALKVFSQEDEQFRDKNVRSVLYRNFAPIAVPFRNNPSMNGAVHTWLNQAFR